MFAHGIIDPCSTIKPSDMLIQASIMFLCDHDSFEWRLNKSQHSTPWLEYTDMKMRQAEQDLAVP